VLKTQIWVTRPQCVKHYRCADLISRSSLNAVSFLILIVRDVTFLAKLFVT